MRLPYASGFIATASRTRSQVTDEAMAVALSVGACPGGASAALKACLKGLLERGFGAFVWVARPKSSAPQGLATVSKEVKKSFVTRYVWGDRLCAP